MSENGMIYLGILQLSQVFAYVSSRPLSASTTSRRPVIQRKRFILSCSKNLFYIPTPKKQQSNSTDNIHISSNRIKFLSTRQQHLSPRFNRNCNQVIRDNTIKMIMNNQVSKKSMYHHLLKFQNKSFNKKRFVGLNLWIISLVMMDL